MKNVIIASVFSTICTAGSASAQMTPEMDQMYDCVIDATIDQTYVMAANGDEDSQTLVTAIALVGEDAVKAILRSNILADIDTYPGLIAMLNGDVTAEELVKDRPEDLHAFLYRYQQCADDINSQ